MKGGWIDGTRKIFGSMLRNNNNTQFGRKLLGNSVNSGIRPVASNGHRSAMNPLGVKMPTNLFGFAKSSNNSPVMSLKERMTRGAEHITRGAKHLSKMANDGSLAELVDNNRVASKLVNNSFNALGNSSITKSFNAGIRKFSTGSSEPH